MNAKDPILFAEALGAYLDTNGDIDKACKALGGKVGKREMRNWEKEYHWPLALDRVMKRVAAREIDNAARRKIQALEILQATKGRLVRAIVGEKDQAGNYIVAPLKARTLEGAAQTLCQIIALEREIEGEKKKEDDARINVFAFIQQIGNGDKTGSRARSSLGIDPLDRFSID